MGAAIEYINTDLVLASCEDLQAFADAMKARDAFALYAEAEADGGSTARFEAGGELCVRGPGRDCTPDGHIGWLLDAVESLPTELRQVWERCDQRVFDLGFACGGRPFGFEQAVSHHVLERVVAHRAALLITIYPVAVPRVQPRGPAWRRYPTRRR